MELPRKINQFEKLNLTIKCMIYNNSVENKSKVVQITL